jgi:hypothetical protein
MTDVGEFTVDGRVGDNGRDANDGHRPKRAQRRHHEEHLNAHERHFPGLKRDSQPIAIARAVGRGVATGARHGRVTARMPFRAAAAGAGGKSLVSAFVQFTTPGCRW